MSRQTKTFLIERFREMGIRPATRHGQNFLIDLNLVEFVVKNAEIDRADLVLPGCAIFEAIRREWPTERVRVADDDTWSDIFSKILVEHVEPQLGQGKPTVLYEYPAPESANQAAIRPSGLAMREVSVIRKLR